MRKTKVLTTGLFLFAVSVTLTGLFFLWTESDFPVRLGSGEVRSMVLELALLYVLFFAELFLIADSKGKVTLLTVTACGFLWIHRVFLPVLAAGLYALYLFLLGNTLTELVSGKKARKAGMIMKDLLSGISLQILTVCLISAFGVGGVTLWRVQVLLTFALVLFLRLFFKERFTPFKVFSDAFLELLPGKDMTGNRSGILFCLLSAFILCSLLLEAGRLNVAFDYDSLHYGVRSAFVLDNGNGIYESLGSVNDVYVYPKGMEILMLPLSGLPSPAFVTAGSLAATAGTLFCAAFLVNRATGVRVLGKGVSSGLFAAAVLSAIPGVMVMAASAKTDAMTLFVQLAGLCLFLTETEREKPQFPFCGIGAMILSLTLKPTSFLFSFLLTVAGVLFWGGRCLKEKRTGKPSAESLLFCALSVLTAAAVTMRTVLLAGVPLTTAGLFLWEKLGFSMQYPFAGLSMGDSAPKGFLSRLFGLFIAPVGEEMDHVYIAWGSGIPFLCLLLCLAALIAALSGKKKRKPAGEGLLFLSLLLTCLASCYLVTHLWQLDGNYFMLFYALSVITAFVLLRKPVPVFAVLLPALLLAFSMSLVTDWAGSLGFGETDPVNKGYEDREGLNREEAYREGKGEIWEVLSEDPGTRVLALAEQPGCFTYPCNVQSYTDLEGNGGNVAILKHYEDFLGFLSYMEADFLYVEEDFIMSRSRAADLVSYMLEDGSLEEICASADGSAVLYRFTGVKK